MYIITIFKKLRTVVCSTKATDWGGEKDGFCVCWMNRWMSVPTWILLSSWPMSGEREAEVSKRVQEASPNVINYEQKVIKK